ncbi:hypothetical protein Patl1_14577 [Pistacia atlantica]|uniref:Uncharacterized protein n=1 Tax=Pistacia atlantica TaxID=434234 RepID=A0ACC1AYI3_9ROSI|nr:hypothetical protein Patl1_14577 [Pistacia atlantica]
MKPKTFVAKLLHFDYVFHHPNDTLEYRAERMLNRSIARLVHLYGKDSKTPSADAKLYSLKEYENQAFYVSFKIGQPPVP